MSTQWRKHLTFIVYLSPPPWIESDCDSDAAWHIVVRGQTSLAVLVPKEFPCWRHRAEILSLIVDSDMDHFSFAILSQNAEGEWTLIFRAAPEPALRCSLWAPLVDEREIYVLEWITGEVKLAVWRGTEVIVKVGTSPYMDENHHIANQSEAYRFLQGTELTPKFLGHLVRNGIVIGFVLEALIGRAPGPSNEDREACREAALRFHAAGAFHSDLNKNNMIMTDQGVRFVDIELCRAGYTTMILEEVDRVFDDEIAMFPETEWKPPRQEALTLEEVEKMMEGQRDLDVELRGVPPAMPPVRKDRQYYDNPWRMAPLIPYVPDAYKGWVAAEARYPSTIEGTTGPSDFPYHQYLSTGYLSYQLSVVVRGRLPGFYAQREIPTGDSDSESGPSDTPLDTQDT